MILQLHRPQWDDEGTRKLSVCSAPSCSWSNCKLGQCCNNGQKRVCCGQACCQVSSHEITPLCRQSGAHFKFNPSWYHRHHRTESHESFLLRQYEWSTQWAQWIVRIRLVHTLAHTKSHHFLWQASCILVRKQVASAVSNWEDLGRSRH